MPDLHFGELHHAVVEEVVELGLFDLLELVRPLPLELVRVVGRELSLVDPSLSGAGLLARENERDQRGILCDAELEFAFGLDRGPCSFRNLLLCGLYRNRRMLDRAHGELLGVLQVGDDDDLGLLLLAYQQEVANLARHGRLLVRLRLLLLVCWLLDLAEGEVAANVLLFIGKELVDEEEVPLTAELLSQVRESGESQVIGADVAKLAPVRIVGHLFVALHACLALLPIEELVEEVQVLIGQQLTLQRREVEHAAARASVERLNRILLRSKLAHDHLPRVLQLKKRLHKKLCKLGRDGFR